MTYSKHFRLILCLLLATVAGPGMAQPPGNRAGPAMDGHRFYFEAGGYLANVNSNCRIGAQELGLGLDINFEEALGLETTALTYYGLARYIFSKNYRSLVKVRYFEVSRRSTKTLGRDIQIGDREFYLGTELGTLFSLKVINADYSYSFLMDERVRISGTFGLFIMPMKFTFRAGSSEGTASDLVAPLPVIGLESYFLLSRRFALNQGLHLFYLKIGDLQGKMTDIFIDLEYRPVPRLVLGLGFNSFGVNIRQGKDSDRILGNFIGNVGYQQTGVTLSAGFSF